MGITVPVDEGGAVILRVRTEYGPDANKVLVEAFRAAAGKEQRRMVRRLAEQVKGLGEQGALELLARIGMVLGDVETLER